MQKNNTRHAGPLTALAAFAGLLWAAALHGQEIVAVPLGQASKTRHVDPGGELVRYAREVGVVFGDETG